MIPIEEARRRIRAATPEPVSETIPLGEAEGLVLAEEVTAPEPLPHFDNSAMDGYAVRLHDSEDGGNEAESNVRLTVRGEARAGSPWEGTLGPGEAVQIATGAPVPEGTGRVIPVEEVDREGDDLRVCDAGRPENHIRFRGEEVRRGALVAPAGRPITPPRFAQLASFGVTELSVYRPPSVAVLTTGSELVEPEEELGPGQIRNSNRYGLEAFVRAERARTAHFETVPDTREATVDAIGRAAEAADIVLTTGGVSVGPHDHVKAAAEACGFTEQFWKVRQKPGKPLFFADRDETLLFGLPGNPFSALINATVHVGPVIRRLSGREPPRRVPIPVTLVSPYDGLKPGRVRYLLVRRRSRIAEGRDRVEVVERQRSHMLAGMSEADGFVLVDARRDRLCAGKELDLHPFPWSFGGS